MNNYLDLYGLMEFVIGMSLVNWRC